MSGPSDRERPLGWMTATQALARLPALARGRLPFTFDGMPMAARGLSLRKMANLALSGIDSARRAARPLSLPPGIQIEPTNLCNLRCPLCPTGSGIMKRPRGQMSLATLNRILDQLGHVLVSAVLYGWGEPFLNEDLPAMIEACAARGIVTVTATNGNCLQTLDEALAVVDAGLQGVVIALDGSTQATYEAYRKGGSVEKVKRCAALLEEAKALRGSATPYTNVRAVVMRENEGDLAEIGAAARAAGVNMFSVKSVGCTIDSLAFSEYEATDAGLRRFSYRGGRRLPGEPVRCPYVFRQPTVFWDGTVVGCEFDYNAEEPWGNLNEMPFRRVWQSAAAVRQRRGIRGARPRPAFCDVCPYEGRNELSCVLSTLELRPA